jgi:hypothetical protein
MEHVKKELHDGLKYHMKQLEENLNKMRLNEEANKDFEQRNEKHKEAISEIKFYLEALEKTEKAAT